LIYHILILIYRFEPLTDKNDGKPVFIEDSKGYKDRARIEMNDKHMKLMWANGLTPLGTRPGNLSVEWCNAEIKRCNFKLGMQNLVLMYQRSVVIALMINKKKWIYWKQTIENESETYDNDIYLKMNNIFERLFDLSYIWNQRSLVPTLQVKPGAKEKRVKLLVEKDDLLFCDKYERGSPTVVQLLNWFRINCPQQKNNTYNEKILLAIFQNWDSKYSKTKIVQKLHSIGIFYDNSK